VHAKHALTRGFGAFSSKMLHFEYIFHPKSSSNKKQKKNTIYLSLAGAYSAICGDFLALR
jgi:hypothetical protein